MNLRIKTFLLGLLGAVIIYFISDNFEVPLLIFILHLVLISFQYLYLPWREKAKSQKENGLEFPE